MRIALIGSNGLLGSSIKKILAYKKIDTLLLTHENFEITDSSTFETIFQYKPDILINTAAFLGVEPCEKNPIKAFNINTKAVGDLARLCNNTNVIFVQISTDAVFDGIRGDYNELSTPNPINLYGLTKYNAEQLVKALCNKYYIFRLPILFGQRENIGNIFVDKIYNLYKEGKKEFKIADDVINRPSYSKDIANKLVEILLSKKDYGIYHIFNDGNKASLYDFAKEFFQAKNIHDVLINKAKADDFSRNELGKKPLNTSLNSIKIAPLRDWKEAMKEYCKE